MSSGRSRLTWLIAHAGTDGPLAERWRSYAAERRPRVGEGIVGGAQENTLLTVEGLVSGSWRLAVRDAMQSLSPAHRQILELFYGQDRKQTEIAELLGLPLGTVKTRSYYALRALKLALQERGINA